MSNALSAPKKKSAGAALLREVVKAAHEDNAFSAFTADSLSADKLHQLALLFVREIIGSARLCEVLLVPDKDLTLAQFSILDRLATSTTGSVPQESLVSAHETGSPSNVSMQLTGMQRAKWIRRDRPANEGAGDSRKLSVALTPAGRKRYERALKAFRDRVETYLQHYKPEDFSVLFLALRTFRRFVGDGVVIEKGRERHPNRPPQVTEAEVTRNACEILFMPAKETVAAADTTGAPIGGE